MDQPRILIVDDDTNVVRILARTFENSGFSVTTAANGELAYGLLGAEDAFDAMICDVQMPRLTGQELCERLASDGPYIPSCVLLVTSRSDVEIREWVAAIPSVNLVEKPIGPKQLLRTVRHRLEEHDSDAEFGDQRRAA